MGKIVTLNLQFYKITNLSKAVVICTPIPLQVNAEWINMGKLQSFEIVFSQTPGVYYGGTRVQGMVTVMLSEPMSMRSEYDLHCFVWNYLLVLK